MDSLPVIISRNWLFYSLELLSYHRLLVTKEVFWSDIEPLSHVDIPIQSKSRSETCEDGCRDSTTGDVAAPPRRLPTVAPLV